ncbi:hypothetical protein RND81_01G192700 [Saponaria officinalis]|uniref:Membrane-associated kinase regulator 6 n=1 Tax=Saponaria officinalis TaxID=3572 RepID=A0AAW1NJQ9_SAPOF
MNNISQHLETESFSYRWLATEQPSSKNPNTNLTSKSTLTRNNNDEDDPSPNFDFETSSTTEFTIVHADKLFSNGVIKPQYLTTTDTKTDTIFKNDNNYDNPSHNNHLISPTSSSSDDNAGEIQGIFPRKWKKLPMKIVSKYLRCFGPVSKTRGRIRVDDENRRKMEGGVGKSDRSSSQESSTSPRVCALSDSDESSIHEAILYCKQSNGF